MTSRVQQFISAATLVGAEVQPVADIDQLASYIAARVEGGLLLAPSPSLERAGCQARLEEAGVEVFASAYRERAAGAAAGLSGANFGIASTGTVVLESTPEAVRITSTLPEKHFVVLDPGKIVDDEQVSGLLETFHEHLPRTYLAYLTGPSRTADIERVLTIGVHGPKELHILLLEGLSDDPMER